MNEQDVFEILVSELTSLMDNGNYYSALTLVLTIPGICASIDSERGSTQGKDEKLYKNWLNEYTCYKNNKRMLTSQIVYKTRCRLLHNGRFLSEKKDKNDKIDVYFALPANIKLISDNGSVRITTNGKTYLQINIEDFVQNILVGVSLWRQKVCKTENYKNYVKDAIKFGLPHLGIGSDSNLPVLQ